MIQFAIFVLSYTRGAVDIKIAGFHGMPRKHNTVNNTRLAGAISAINQGQGTYVDPLSFGECLEISNSYGSQHEYPPLKHEIHE